jgi:hypothetical protein
MVGSSLRLTARLTSEKSRASSRIIAKRPSAQNPLVLMALSFTRVTATCPINFCRTALTSEPICMVVPSKIGPASCFKWWKRWFRCGAATVSLCASAPGGTWNGVSDGNPIALFDYVAKQLNRFGLAYLHVIEPRIKGNVLIAEGQGHIAATRLRKVFTGTIIAAGGFEPDTAEAAVREGDADLVAFGRHFLANPDLPKRIRLGRPLSAYDRDTFYTFDARGYTDYPFYEQRSESLASTL